MSVPFLFCFPVFNKSKKSVLRRKVYFYMRIRISKIFYVDKLEYKPKKHLHMAKNPLA